MQGIKLIALNGAKTVGKSTIANALAALSDDVVIVSFATPIRAMLEAMGVDQHNLNVAKEEPIEGLGKSARQLLCSLGTEWGRGMANEEIWLWAMQQQIQKLIDGATKPEDLVVVIDDCRFANEAEWVRKVGGDVVRLIRDGITYSGDHSSEQPLPDDLIDWEFDAGGVQNCIKNIVQLIII
tara:strand:- start:37 stop:582 length:546 start_codon:yes stop_codon:yes gene_type:complete